MKFNHIIIFTLFIVLTQGCGIDSIENPNVTTEKYIDSPQAAATWVNGARAELASDLGFIIEMTELTSDNYYNNRTLSSKVFDIPQIVYTDVDVNRLQAAVHAIRRTAEFGLETVLPNDEISTPENEAELYFYIGVSHLFAGEYFVGLPGEDLGPVLTPNEQFALALEAFNKTVSLSSDIDRIQAANLAKARIAFYQNNIPELQSLAQTVIDGSPMLNYQVQHDGVNGPTNNFQFYLYNSSQDEFAPLPRLDFLDPKYFSEDGAGQDQKPVSLFKVEEAYLMLAEADLVNGNLALAKTRLVDLLNNVIANRPLYTIDDSRETRAGGNRADYPLSDTVLVKFSPDGPPLAGLILDRQAGPIHVPAVSGTSVTSEKINNSTTIDGLLEIIYLMRQEIFIAEGRRVIDLGIKYPVSESEQQNNSAIEPDSPYLQAQIPSFIPLAQEMDDFTVDENTGIVTIHENMNRMLVENKTSASILPLW